MKKATKGKNGCLKPNGRLKKGFRWAKGRKGYCLSTKKSAAKKKRQPPARPIDVERADELKRIAAMRGADRDRLIGSQAMDGLRRRRRRR